MNFIHRVFLYPAALSLLISKWDTKKPMRKCALRFLFAEAGRIWITSVIPFLNIEPACRQAGVEQGTLNFEL